MQRRRSVRWVAYAAALGLALALAGDGGRAATVPAAIYGQDPLEVLSLKVRPNVIVVLDTSGSMKWNLEAPASPPSNYYPPMGGDHPRSKVWLAKQVLKKIVQDNQDKVSFLFGQYTQDENQVMQNRTATLATATSGKNRFSYSTHSCAGGCPAAVNDSLANAPVNNGLLESPTMATTALSIRNDRGGSNDRGLQSWQLVYEEWKNFYYEEDIPGTNAICTATMPGITAATPKFYRDGGPSTTAGTFAADLRNAINGAACTPSRPSGSNLYDVAYNATTGVFTISRTSGSYLFRPLWTPSSGRPANIRGALGSPSTPSLGTGPFSSNTPYTLLYRGATAVTNNPNHGGGFTGLTYTNQETVAGTTVTFYTALAGRFFNGETIRVQSDGQICGMTFPAAADRTNPPSFRLQQVNANCGADVAGAVAVFRWGGAAYTGGTSLSCNGFNARVALIPCDLPIPPAPTQFGTIGPWLDNEFPLDANGVPHPAPADLDPAATAGATTTGYTEVMDGTWATASYPPHYAGGLKGYGATPIAASLDDIQVEFGKLWSNGGSTMVPPNPQLDPISAHLDPKEKTIVLFVTDGEDTCAGQGDNDRNALAAARSAELLYRRIDATQPASSVQTFVIGFGGAFDATIGSPRLNWIAWGGSGLGDAGTGQPDVPVSGIRWNPSYTGTYSATCAAGSQCQSINSALAPLRADCTTCQDAFLAPDPETLARQLQSIIDQGAQDGDFVAAQSITENIFEYVDKASDGTTTYDARSPSTRYRAITPTRFITSFSLPGFRGQVSAYQNDGAGNTVLKWSAGNKLNALVRSGFTGTNCPATNGANAGECMFATLHGGVGSDPASSAAVIKRRVYTTERNGLFDYTASSLMAGTANQRVNLWPPQSGAIVPADYTTQGTFDVALGLPADSTTQAAADFTALQRRFQACAGTNLPAACTNADPLVRMKAARREARELVLAFMAGAKPLVATGGLKRTGTSGGAADRNQILYTYRDWVLADSELATAAVVTPPLPSEPEATPYLAEYRLFRDGPRDASGKNPDTGGTQIPMGFGLRNPDVDGTTASGQNDSRTALKPVMTVVYAPANDMLHAFRAGPNTSPSGGCDAYAATLNPTYDCGGEELWGFVPFDQLGTLTLLAANQPPGRDNHVYMLARGVRFSDVFVPQALTNVTIGGVTQATMQGVWRRVLYVGRGIGGKYVTALDVTAPGTFTDSRLQAQGPIPLWSRGNPDTATGLGTGAANGDANDTNAYRAMGQTWSIPVVAYVGGQSFYANARRSGRAGCSPGGGTGCPVDHVLFMGSGYGEASGEGTTFYTLDALTGDVVASVDVETVASSYGLNRSPKPTDQQGVEYDNALVANPAGFNPRVFSPLATVHPAAAQVTRVYFGDLYGRLWKVLTAQPNVAIPVADLGVEQPIGTAASLLGLPPQPDAPVPYVFVTSGAERRRDGPFRMFGFWDKGDDVTTATSGTSTTCVDATAPCEPGVTSYLPVEMVFNRIYDQGQPEASCGYTEEAVFRGTTQPATAFECSSIVAQPGTGAQQCVDILGRVFFAGTRLSLPNTKYAPPTPLACGQGDYPCRSQFDSILYALGAKTGNAAYDLNASGDDAYRVFRDSRLTAIQMLADPDPGRGGSSFTPDEGQIKGTPKPPPPPGVPPTANTATANVVMTREPGQPPPAVRYGSTVCQ